MPGEHTILCVDDHKVLLDTVVRVLADAGFKTLAAQDIPAAIELARRNKIDVVLLDFHQCPGCSGTDPCLAEHVLAIQPAVKVLVWCTDESIFETKPPCAQAMFMKPVHPRELIAQIESVLGG